MIWILIIYFTGWGILSFVFYFIKDESQSESDCMIVGAFWPLIAVILTCLVPSSIGIKIAQLLSKKK